MNATQHLPAITLSPAALELASELLAQPQGEPSDVFAKWELVRSDYVWHYESGEALVERLKSTVPLEGEAFLETVRSIHRDLCAYAHLTAYRTHELVWAGLHLLDQRMFVAAAGASRSALETSLTLVRARHMWEDLVANVTVPAGQHINVSVSEPLDEYLRQAMWGGRGEGYEIQSTNIETTRKAVRKRLEQDEAEHLDRTYAALSEVVHPSATGHWIRAHLEGEVDPTDITSARRYKLSWDHAGPVGVDVGVDIVWALAWSSRQTVDAYLRVCGFDEAGQPTAVRSRAEAESRHRAAADQRTRQLTAVTRPMNRAERRKASRRKRSS